MGAGREKFPPDLFRVCAFSIPRARLSRSLEQARIPAKSRTDVLAFKSGAAIYTYFFAKRENFRQGIVCLDYWFLLTGTS